MITEKLKSNIKTACLWTMLTITLLSVQSCSSTEEPKQTPEQLALIEKRKQEAELKRQEEEKKKAKEAAEKKRLAEYKESIKKQFENWQAGTPIKIDPNKLVEGGKYTDDVIRLAFSYVGSEVLGGYFGLFDLKAYDKNGKDIPIGKRGPDFKGDVAEIVITPKASFKNKDGINVKVLNKNYERLFNEDITAEISPDWENMEKNAEAYILQCLYNQSQEHDDNLQTITDQKIANWDWEKFKNKPFTIHPEHSNDPKVQENKEKIAKFTKELAARYQKILAEKGVKIEFVDNKQAADLEVRHVKRAEVHGAANGSFYAHSSYSSSSRISERIKGFISIAPGFTGALVEEFHHAFTGTGFDSDRVNAPNFDRPTVGDHTVERGTAPIFEAARRCMILDLPLGMTKEEVKKVIKKQLPLRISQVKAEYEAKRAG